MGGSSGKVEVTWYALSVHLGVCITGHDDLDAPGDPVTELRAIYVGEKLAWEGSVTSNTTLTINKQQMFGGPGQEGGVAGRVSVLMGRGDQTMPENLASKLSRTTATCPGFRGLVSLFFHEPATALGWIHFKGPGFYWGHNSPYIKTIWVTLRNIFPPADGSEGNPFVPSQLGPDDMNPAWIIYNCLINKVWGMGSPVQALNVDSFRTAAQILLDEEFGMSIIWSAQQSIEEFVNHILDTVQGVLFIDPSNGLFTLKLLRDEEIGEEDDHYNEHNSVLTDFQRKLPGEIINEIQVSWTNPLSEEEEVVIQQDLGSITALGEIVSDSRSYPGIRNVDLATRVCIRDLRAAVAPLATGVLEVNRRGFSKKPGDIIPVTNEEHNLTDVVFRIMRVDYGKIGDPTVKLAIVEDIFKFNVGAYFTPPPTEWEPEAQAAEQIAYTLVGSTPWYFLEPDARTAIIGAETLATVWAAHPGSEGQEYELHSLEVQLNGDVDFETQGIKPMVGYTTLGSGGVVAEADSFILLPNLIHGPNQPAANVFAMFGSDDADDCEIALITAEGEESPGIPTITVRRGQLDTVPKGWPSGTAVWFFDRDTPIEDLGVVRTVDANVTYRLTQITSEGTFPLASATSRVAELSARPHAPFRPADFRINGIGFADEIDCIDAYEIEATWSTRNRTLEEDVPLEWEDAPVAPEAGQTVTLIVYDHPGTTELFRVEGVSSPYLFDVYDFEGYDVVRIKAISTRGGVESIQGHELVIRIAVTPPAESVESEGGESGGGGPGGSGSFMMTEGGGVEESGNEFIVPGGPLVTPED